MAEPKIVKATMSKNGVVVLDFNNGAYIGMGKGPSHKWFNCGSGRGPHSLRSMCDYRMTGLKREIRQAFGPNNIKRIKAVLKKNVSSNGILLEENVQTVLTELID